jgi:hypothetical protein
LLSQPDQFYRTNGYAVLAALVLIFAWPFFAWQAGDSANPVRGLESGLPFPPKGPNPTLEV